MKKFLLIFALFTLVGCKAFFPSKKIEEEKGVITEQTEKITDVKKREESDFKTEETHKSDNEESKSKEEQSTTDTSNDSQGTDETRKGDSEKDSEHIIEQTTIIEDKEGNKTTTTSKETIRSKEKYQYELTIKSWQDKYNQLHNNHVSEVSFLKNQNESHVISIHRLIKENDSLQVEFDTYKHEYEVSKTNKQSQPTAMYIVIGLVVLAITYGILNKFGLVKFSK